MNPRTMLRTTLALGLGVLALTTSAWAASTTYNTYACKIEKFKVRYYASDVDTYHNKRVVAYCDYDYAPISCEAEIFGSHDYSSEKSKYFVALNEVHPYQSSGRYGCAARANTFYANYDNFHEDASWEDYGDYDFAWGLKVYATCVPKHCVETYQGDGDYEWYEHSGTHEEPEAPVDQPETPEDQPENPEEQTVD